MIPKSEEVTRLLAEAKSGDRRAREQAMELVYHELRRIAARYMQSEQKSHTLQATALVHEAYLRLVQQKDTDWENRSHFMGIAAQMMRRVLVDHARAKNAVKRGSGQVAVSLLDEMVSGKPESPADLLALDMALTELETMSERQARVVELRFFCGMSIEETAESLKSSPATIKRDWTSAKTWLYKRLQDGAPA